MSAPELLPCPFCGTTPRTHKADALYVFCHGCTAEGPLNQSGMALEKWNTRADLSPAPDIGALVEAIEALGAPRPMWLRRLLSPIPTTCPRCGQHLTAYPDGGAGGYCSACEGGKDNG